MDFAQGLLAAVESWQVAGALRGSGTLYLFVNAAHILGVGLILGAILPLDLALLGLVRGAPLAVIGPFLSRAAAVGVVLALATGLLLWAVRPREYLENEAFLWKMGLLALALANVGLQHGLGGWRRVVAGEGVPAATRVMAGLSSALWLGTLLAGRWIGFL
ncbi:hypothetical protein GCM10007301_26080 [Azorhizobium oxalatiphilum]|uniref:DUF2214 domain-containing protein n=1 Tax=Azorhizobium oxalatiphilum TaxID=980631 RepID=A0A917FDJ5_9HYPH|nr:DUF2214 domain-containing protein [Azorhizobium oxalatiphilum]GGF65050.1 hypothetical protein GCM10007301_26080 [Azorhizobium oxalatiphilum]